MVCCFYQYVAPLCRHRHQRQHQCRTPDDAFYYGPHLRVAPQQSTAPHEQEHSDVQPCANRLGEGKVPGGKAGGDAGKHRMYAQEYGKEDNG
jgi:hypothetical protein